MSTNDLDLRPPFLEVTPNDHGAWVIVASSLFIIITVLVVTVTLFSRIKVLRSLSWSDVFLSLATVGNIPFVKCNVSYAANKANGSGVRVSPGSMHMPCCIEWSWASSR